MFRQSVFAEEDPAVVVSMLRDAAFGHLVAVGSAGLVSTPLPFSVGDDLVSVHAHVAARNPIVDAAGADALLVVSSVDGYVSPSWYPSKAEHGRVVPTWNYEVVHVHGRLSAHRDPEWLRRQIERLTQENETGRDAPWSVDDAPPDFVTRQLAAIVGLELEVTRVEAKRKLSQNRSAADREGAIAGLVGGSTTDQRLADAMRR